MDWLKPDDGMNELLIQFPVIMYVKYAVILSVLLKTSRGVVKTRLQHGLSQPPLSLTCCLATHVTTGIKS